MNDFIYLFFFFNLRQNSAYNQIFKNAESAKGTILHPQRNKAASLYTVDTK